MLPDAVDNEAQAIRVAGQWHRTLAVVGYPRDVGPGWLEPLISYRGAIDVALFVEPVPTVVAADRLRRQLARLESARRIDANRGRLIDPHIDVAADDAHDLASRLARGEGRLFRVGLYVTVRATDRTELDQAVQQMRGLLASLLLECQPTTYRHLQGWVSTLPLGSDRIGARRTFDTPALASAYPFAPRDPASGVLYGIDPVSRGMVRWDRFAQDNYHAVVLAASGAGKSYHAKLEALRSLYAGIDIIILDPEDEYRRMADAVGGVCLQLGANGVRINPFDLPPDAAEDGLYRRALFMQTVVAVLLGRPINAAERPALDRAVMAAYDAAGITAERRTHTRPAPLMENLVSILEADDDQAATELARQLTPFTTGSHRRLFDGPTTVQPEGHIVVYGFRDLPDELRAAGMLLVLDAVWRRVTDPAQRRRRCVVVDEAWRLLRDPAGAQFLSTVAKAGRKHWVGLTVITQDVGDLLSTELGRIVVANASTHVLLRQAAQNIEALGQAFDLSEGECAWLLAANRGEGILVAGRQRTAFRAVASRAEHRLVTTDPAELAAQEGVDPGRDVPAVT